MAGAEGEERDDGWWADMPGEWEDMGQTMETL